MTPAEIAYAKQHAAAAALLAQLQEALFDLPAPDSDTKIDWSHVGSLAEINRQLKETFDFMAGTNA
jgi:hypothetical protein